MDLDTCVENFTKKDVKAFETLYDMYSDNICGAINIIVRNDVMAQEICQDVFVKVWENAHNYDASKGRFFTWILNIARNAAIDKVRSKSYKREKKNLPVDYFVGMADEDGSIDQDIDAVGLKNLIRNLKKKCLQIIEMLYFRGYTQREASEELNIPLGTVKTRNRNCIAQLRKNLTLTNER